MKPELRRAQIRRNITRLANAGRTPNARQLRRLSYWRNELKKLTK